MSGDPLPYRAGTSETGIQTEIYLPKKSYFQGTLYDTLTDGFDKNHVKKTIIKNIEEVKKLMKDFTVPLISKGLEKPRIKKMKPIFWGYSMYEVDGVFCAAPESVKRVDEERTQVIRVLFRPDLEDILKVLVENDIVTTLDSIKNSIYNLYQPNGISRESLTKGREKEVSAIRDYLEEWRWDIQLFLFGYVINEVCKQIRKVSKSGIKPEDEIWVSSFWGTQISRVVLKDYS